MRLGDVALVLLMVACSSNGGTPALFVDGGAQINSDLPTMPAHTWNSASAEKTTASFQGLSGPAIAMTISNVVVPDDVCGVAPFLAGSAVVDMFALEIKVAADGTGNPLPGTFGNDASSASFTMTDAMCKNPKGMGTITASNVVVDLQVGEGTLLSGTADLTFPSSHFTVSFVAPMCAVRPAILGPCTALPGCGDAGTTATCMSWP